MEPIDLSSAFWSTATEFYTVRNPYGIRSWDGKKSTEGQGVGPLLGDRIYVTNYIPGYGDRKRINLEGALNSVTTGSVYDNWWIQHPIPQNDYQYSSIGPAILTGNLIAGSGLGHAPPSGLVSGSVSTRLDTPGQLVPAVTFLSASEYSASVTLNVVDTSTPRGQAGIHVDFVGLNTVMVDTTGSAFNILAAPAEPITTASTTPTER